MGRLSEILKSDSCRDTSPSGSGVGRSIPGSSVVDIASPFEGEALSGGCVVRANESMARQTTLHVGGPADWYVEPASEDDVSLIVRCCRRRGLPLLVIGNGSNLLVKDGGIRGVVLALRHPVFHRIVVDGTVIVCGAGVPLNTVARVACDNGISGFEFMEGIPGTVGGALRMNAGAFGACTLDLVKAVRYVDKQGAVGETSVSGLCGRYRDCSFFSSNIALAAMFLGKPGDRELIHKKMESMKRHRQATQPRGWSAGCVFKNTSKGAAGLLIDQAGLKGYRVGKAVVSEVHANFFMNEGGATARDFLELIARVRDRVKDTFGIELEPEVQIVGDDEESSGATDGLR